MSAENDLEIFGFPAKNKRFPHSPFVEWERMNLSPTTIFFLVEENFSMLAKTQPA